MRFRGSSKPLLEPPQLDPLDVEEQLLSDNGAPDPVPEGAPCHPAEETHFKPLVSEILSFRSVPKSQDYVRVRMPMDR